MKFLVTALAMMLTMALTMALTMGVAAAQGVSTGGPVGSMDGNRKGRAQSSDVKPRPVDDKDYKAALKSLPDKPYDPWSKTR
jgi:hypothetical protein